MAVENKIINAESGGQRYEKNPRSSAYGPGQFLSSTWLNMISRYRPDLMQGRDSAAVLALRTDPTLNAEMTRRYGEENGRFLASKGFEPNEGNIYLAHFAGPSGAVKLLQNPDKPAAEVLGPAVVEANPFLANWKAADVDAWADRKMGWKPVTGAPLPREAADAMAQSSSPPPIPKDAIASAAGSPNSAPAAAQPQKEMAVLPFLASLFGGGAGAGAAAGGAAGLGSQLSGSGGLLSSLFGGGEGGGFDFSKMMNDGGQPDPTNPLAGQPGAPPMGLMPRPQVDMRGLQAMIANRPQLGGPGVLR